MKKYLLLLSLLFLLVIPSFTIAQETIESEDPEAIAQKYGITFPISELGNCIDYSSCRSYCEDPINQVICIDFAKKKGFYKEEIEANTELLDKAQNELGCDSRESCKAVCEQPSNYEKCHAFAKNYNVSGGYEKNPNKSEIIEKAKTVLGCDSAQSCKSICEDESNRQKCSDFAKEVGLRGGESNKGPGGCNSKETCQSFCSDPQNYQICSQYTKSSGKNFQGPGGCNSESSCRTYCESNPQECRHGGDETPQYNPQEMCSKTPSCSWIENSCQCGFYESSTDGAKRKAEEYARFCRENPERCKSKESGSFESSQKREEFEKYCTENPDKCRYDDSNTQPTGGSSPDPATECAKYPGCSWTNNSCQCSNTGESSNTSGSSSNDTSGSNYSTDPQTACGQTQGCSWNGSTCQCSQVQGVTITETFVQKILHFFFP
ncbi:hypothetical protein HYT02_03975 [Candidatus Gottesmanbacteria bacterium]|nr:hypothetical protein [Candidatus Gottesmanbacteria bacterium]